MAGVRVSIGPVKPKIIPTFMSAKATVEIEDRLRIAARINFFIFPPNNNKLSIIQNIMNVQSTMFSF
jgi:hypothetical protein